MQIVSWHASMFRMHVDKRLRPYSAAGKCCFPAAVGYDSAHAVIPQVPGDCWLAVCCLLPGLTGLACCIAYRWRRTASHQMS